MDKYLTVHQIIRDLKAILKSINRSDAESEYFYISLLNVIRWAPDKHDSDM